MSELDEIRADIAELKEAQAPPRRSPVPSRAPALLDWQVAIGKQVELARQARFRAIAEGLEQARKQAERDAPRRAKRDRELAVFDEQIHDLETERTRLEERIGALRLERLGVQQRWAREGLQEPV